MAETKDLTPAPEREIQITPGGLAPKDHAELWRTCEFLARSSLKPDGLKTQADVFLVVLMGMEIGYSIVTALQSFHVINGRVGIPGETAAALIQGSGLCEDWRTGVEGEGDEMVGWVQSHRRGRAKPYPRTEFSVADAKQAGLWGKEGNWKKYPKVMLVWRAVGQHARINWSDVTKRTPLVEELQDYDEPREVRDVTPARESPPLEGPDPLLLDAGATPLEAPDEPFEPEVVPDDDLPAADAPAEGFGPDLAPEPSEALESDDPADGLPEADPDAEEEAPPPKKPAPKKRGPKPKVEEPPLEEPPQAFVSEDDARKLWDAAVQRADHYIDGGYCDHVPDRRDDAKKTRRRVVALAIYDAVLKDCGYPEGSYTQILADDFRRLRGKLQNARLPPIEVAEDD